MTTLKLLPVFASAMLAVSQIASAEVPKGWHANGSGLSDYSVVTDKDVSYSGHPSVSVASKKTLFSPSGFAGLMQATAANDYRGKRVRVSAFMKTRDVTGGGALGAHLWFRVDGPNGQMLGFDNMDSRPVTGTTDWTKYEIVLDVPQDSIALAYGFFLNGAGKVWASSFTVEDVGVDVPSTNSLLKQPTNLDFEQ